MTIAIFNISKIIGEHVFPKKDAERQQEIAASKRKCQRHSELVQQDNLGVDGNSVQPGNTTLHYQVGEGYPATMSCQVAGWS